MSKFSHDKVAVESDLDYAATEVSHPTSKRQATKADIELGQRVFNCRQLAVPAMTQEELADELELTFQQVQKYENGANRIPATRLFEMARIFGKRGVPLQNLLPEDLQIEGSSAASAALITGLLANNMELAEKAGRARLALDGVKALLQPGANGNAKPEDASRSRRKPRVLADRLDA